MNRHGRRSARLRGCLAACRLAAEVTPAPEGADFGMSVGVFRRLVLIARKDLARLRAELLAPLLDRAARSWTWDECRPRLEALGVLRAQDSPPELDEVVVRCHPRTGPPVLAPGDPKCRRGPVVLAARGSP